MALLVLSHSLTAEAQLKGDAEGVAAVERMLAATGGKRAWADARSLYLEYRGWRVSPRGQSVTERAWRDLRQPNQRIEWKGEGVDVIAAFTPARGWRMRSGIYQVMDEQAHRNELTFWPRDFYTLFRRFAVDDPDLFVQFRSPHKVVVRSTAQGEIGWFEIDSEGTPVRWGTLYNGEPLEYVYGPLKPYGAVRFPAWGARLDGGWRFEYVRVELSPGPVSESLLTTPVK